MSSNVVRGPVLSVGWITAGDSGRSPAVEWCCWCWCCSGLSVATSMDVKTSADGYTTSTASVVVSPATASVSASSCSSDVDVVGVVRILSKSILGTGIQSG